MNPATLQAILKPTQLNYMHRFSGGIVVIASNVHTLGHGTPILTDHDRYYVLIAG
jgi:hypothetical protein